MLSQKEEILELQKSLEIKRKEYDLRVQRCNEKRILLENKVFKIISRKNKLAIV